jgi:hypothetical protein
MGLTRNCNQHAMVRLRLQENDRLPTNGEPFDGDIAVSAWVGLREKDALGGTKRPFTTVIQKVNRRRERISFPFQCCRKRHLA